MPSTEENQWNPFTPDKFYRPFQTTKDGRPTPRAKEAQGSLGSAGADGVYCAGSGQLQRPGPSGMTVSALTCSSAV